MKTFKHLLTACVSAALIFSITPLLRVSAQDVAMDSQQIDRILSNCTTAKNTLNQLHASDALLRVNMGQSYESMSTKLMDGFNARVSNNKYNNNALVLASNNYNSELDNFRSDYKTYEEQLASAINTDCLKQPVSFYDSVASARTDRNRVHADIIKLNQAIDQYQAAISQFEKNYQLVNSGVKN